MNRYFCSHNYHKNCTAPFLLRFPEVSPHLLSQTAWAVALECWRVATVSFCKPILRPCAVLAPLLQEKQTPELPKAPERAERMTKGLSKEWLDLLGCFSSENKWARWDLIEVYKPLVVCSGGCRLPSLRVREIRAVKWSGQESRSKQRTVTSRSRLPASRCFGHFLHGSKGRWGKYLEGTALLEVPKWPHQAQETFELKIIPDWESAQRKCPIRLPLLLA